MKYFVAMVIFAIIAACCFGDDHGSPSEHPTQSPSYVSHAPTREPTPRYNAPTMAPTQSAAVCSAFVRVSNSSFTDACKSCLMLGCNWCSSGGGSCVNGAYHCEETEYSGSSSTCDLGSSTGIMFYAVAILILVPVLCFSGCIFYFCRKGWCGSCSRLFSKRSSSISLQHVSPIPHAVPGPTIASAPINNNLPVACAYESVIVQGIPMKTLKSSKTDSPYLPVASAPSCDGNGSNLPSFVLSSPQAQPIVFATVARSDVENH